MKNKSVKSFGLCLLVAFAVLLAAGCKEKTELPTVSTGAATVYNDTKTVACEGSVSDDGGAVVYERGICYQKGLGDPTTDNSTLSGGSGRGSFTCAISITSNGTYSYRAYATNEVGTAYGETKTYEVSDLPTVKTGVYAIDGANQKAVCTGSVTSNGGSLLKATGICYMKGSGTPTINNSCANTSNASPSISVTLNNLEYGQKYSFRAFATNNRGTAYGEVETFNFPAMLPTVSTGTATINGFGAVCTGSVTDAGATPLTRSGICYMQGTGTPTVANTTVNTSNTSTLTAISAHLANLQPSTTYSYRAFASNSKGTGYGQVKTFTMPSGAPTVVTLDHTPSGTWSVYFLNGLVTGYGVGNITGKGICYMVGTGTPTINNSRFIDYDPSDTIGYVVFPGDIDCGTTYSYRAYATNSSGYTGYGAVKTLKPGSTTGTFGTTTLSGSFPTGEYYSNAFYITSNYFSGHGWHPSIYLYMSGLTTGSISGNLTSATWVGYITGIYTSTSSSLRPGTIQYYDDDGNRWIAKSYTINVTSISTVTKRASLTLNAVMFKESEAYNSTTGVVNVDNATTQNLSITITDAELKEQQYKSSHTNQEALFLDKRMRQEAEQRIKSLNNAQRSNPKSRKMSRDKQ